LSVLVRDAAEVMLVVAVGGMLWSAVGKVRRGRVEALHCKACGRTRSRAYPNCPRCGIPLD
jgi:uncharacterized OB-fold protein